MKTSKMTVGRLGEDEACRKLGELGHTIVERNWRCGHLEVDIISIDREGIHFVEVKSRVAPVSAEPEENVTAQKQKHIVAAAKGYLNSQKSYHYMAMDVFFDVVSVIFEGDRVDVTYFPQAYIPLYT